MKILDVKLTYNCNNRCQLCCQDDAIKNITSTLPASVLYDHIHNMTEAEIKDTKVVLTGGEPTLHPNILDIIRELKKCGFEAIQLQSNVTLQCLPLHIEDLVHAGITSFGISLHGCSAVMHEQFTNTEGSFRSAINNIFILSKLGVPVALNCVISKYNIDSLTDIVIFVAENKLADSIQFAFLHITGRADAHHDLVPKISFAAEAVHKAITVAHQYGIGIKSEAIPYCLMRGFERNVAEIDGLNHITILDKTGVINFSECRETSLKAKTHTCKQCLFYSMCEGPWAEYPRLFGWEEFAPVRSVKPNGRN